MCVNELNDVLRSNFYLELLFRGRRFSPASMSPFDKFVVLWQILKIQVRNNENIWNTFRWT